MNPQTTPVIPTAATAAASAPVTDTNQQLAGAAAKQASSGEAPSSYSDMDELKKKNPKLYNKMLEGIASNICSEMKHHTDRLVEIMREGRRRNG